MDSELPIDNTTPADIAKALTPLWVIDNRLAYHAHPDYTDRVLSGMRFDREGKIQNIGDADLPFVSILNYIENEATGVGSPCFGGPHIQYQSTVSMMICAKREYGLMMRDPRAENIDTRYEGVGALEWAQRVKDAIETKAESYPAVDWTLDGTVYQPCVFRLRVAEISNLCWSCVLEVDTVVEQIERAKRSAESSFVFSNFKR